MGFAGMATSHTTCCGEAQYMPLPDTVGALTMAETGADLLPDRAGEGDGVVVLGLLWDVLGADTGEEEVLCGAGLLTTAAGGGGGVLAGGAAAGHCGTGGMTILGGSSSDSESQQQSSPQPPVVWGKF
jgi:hypothetical protein